jgi:hypothetical protein
MAVIWAELKPGCFEKNLLGVKLRERGLQNHFSTVVAEAAA